MREIEANLPRMEIGEKEPVRALAFLGPQRTFTHQAALEMKRVHGYEAHALVEVPSLQEICHKVAGGEILQGIVPIENSTGGPVQDTHKAFIDEDDLQIIGESVLPIHQTLYYQDASQVRIVASKDQGLLQCMEGIKRVFPDAELEAMNSTGAAVERAAKDPSVAGIGSSIADDTDELRGKLDRIDNFEDNPYNATTFVVVRKRGELPPPTGKDKTTLIVDVPDAPGGLYQTLKSLADRGVNLTKIKSLARVDGTVPFLVTVDGHTSDEPIHDALNELENTGRSVKNMGSYPRADYEPEGKSDPDIHSAIKTIQKEAESEQGVKPDEAVIVFTLKNEPRALVKALEPFAHAGVNLTKIDSLPSGNHAEYIFYMAFKNHIANRRELIAQMAQACEHVQLMNIPEEELKKGLPTEALAKEGGE